MKIGRKISGGKYKKQRKKKLREQLGQRRIVKLGKEKRKIMRTRSGKKKIVLLNALSINVKLKSGQVKKTEIKNVIETPSNKFLARQNIITKGTIVETGIGKVRVSNRPSQEGTLNGILME